jgi:hypothetical protein
MSDFGVHALTHISQHPFKEIDMATQAFRFAAASTVLLLATMFTSQYAHAQASDGRDNPGAGTGLGEPMPSAIDLSGDPAWQVYAFERDGIRYLQINDSGYTPRAAVGPIGPTAWVLPIGQDADRVTIDEDVQPPPTSRIVYRDEHLEVVHYRVSGQDYWIVRPAASSQ